MVKILYNLHQSMAFNIIRMELADEILKLLAVDLPLASNWQAQWDWENPTLANNFQELLQETLTRESKSLLETFTTELKYRDTVFINDELVDITPDITEQLTAEYQQMIETVLDEFKQIFKSLRHDTKAFQQKIREVLDIHEGQATELRNRMSEVNMQFEDYRIKREGFLSSLSSTREELFKEFETSLLAICQRGDLNALKDFFKQNFSGIRGRLKKKKLLERPLENGETALHIVAQKGHLELLRYLLQANVNPNVRNKLGYTPLHYAAKAEYKSSQTAVNELLRAGADVNAKGEYERTSLDNACYTGNAYLALSLIKFGAKVNEQTDYEQTPLHTAAWQGHAEVVNLLLIHRADATARNDKGFTALEIAAEMEQYTVIDIFWAYSYGLSEAFCRERLTSARDRNDSKSIDFWLNYLGRLKYRELMPACNDNIKKQQELLHKQHVAEVDAMQDILTKQFKQVEQQHKEGIKNQAEQFVKGLRKELNIVESITEDEQASLRTNNNNRKEKEKVDSETKTRESSEDIQTTASLLSVDRTIEPPVSAIHILPNVVEIGSIRFIDARTPEQQANDEGCSLN